MNPDDGLVDAGTSMVALLDREARALVQRLRVWTPTRWAAASPVDGLSRADLAHHLAAGLAAASGAPVALPRLDRDLALPDQLAVTAHDLVRSPPTEVEARRWTCHLLLHRHHLLADTVPPGLTAALRVPDALEEGAAACSLRPQPSRSSA